jgi:hypothetical protein
VSFGLRLVTLGEMSEQDFETLMEVTRQRLKEPRGPKASAAWAGLFTANAYEKALAASAKSLPKNSKHRAKAKR